MSDVLGFDAWSANARWWQDEFTQGADPEYVEQIIPLARDALAGFDRVLDVGAGEGQIARALADQGTTVVGVDPVPEQIAAARARGGGPGYALGTAHRLPIATAACDGALACLVFEHLGDHEGALDEIERILRPGGRFVLFLNHPLLQTPGSGWVIDYVIDEQYWRVGPYLRVDVSREELAPGVVLPFVHRPLSDYVNALIDRGLDIVEMIEPAPPAGFLARAGEYAAAHEIPRLCVLICRKRP